MIIDRDPGDEDERDIEELYLAIIGKIEPSRMLPRLGRYTPLPWDNDATETWKKMWREAAKPIEKAERDE